MLILMAILSYLSNYIKHKWSRNISPKCLLILFDLTFCFFLTQTRLQSLVSANRSFRSVLMTMIRNEGVFRPLRGIGATVAGAGPAHALYFAAYERLKVDFTSTGSAHHNYLAQGAAASAATVLHDGIMTPAEGIHHVSDKVYACSCSYDKSKWSDDRLSVSLEKKLTWKSPARYIISNVMDVIWFFSFSWVRSQWWSSDCRCTTAPSGPWQSVP